MFLEVRHVSVLVLGMRVLNRLLGVDMLHRLLGVRVPYVLVLYQLQ